MLINTHSYYSLRYGTMDLDTLLSLCFESEHETMALTDINSTSACIDFLREARKHNVKPVLGTDIRLGIVQKYIILAKNNVGFQALNDYLTQYLIDGTDESLSRETLQDCFIIYPFDKEQDLTKLKPNEYVGITEADLHYIERHGLDQSKMVILQTLTFYNNRSYNIHKLLRAIDLNTLLSKLGPEDIADQDQVMVPRTILEDRFRTCPKAIDNTRFILDECEVSFDIAPQAVNHNIKQYTESQDADYAMLKKLAYENIERRYAEVTDELFDRIDTELKMIRQKGFVSYFLVNWDIVQYARQQGYFHVGRGSGANSLVAYLLEITDVDPLELDLYFERFINLHRSSPPDFDIDFSWRDREDITRYIFERYPHVALVGTRNTFQRKAIERELGKVFGLSDAEINTVQATPAETGVIFRRSGTVSETLCRLYHGLP